MALVRWRFRSNVLLGGSRRCLGGSRGSPILRGGHQAAGARPCRFPCNNPGKVVLLVGPGARPSQKDARDDKPALQSISPVLSRPTLPTRPPRSMGRSTRPWSAELERWPPAVPVGDPLPSAAQSTGTGWRMGAVPFGSSVTQRGAPLRLRPSAPRHNSPQCQLEPTRGHRPLDQPTSTGHSTPWRGASSRIYRRVYSIQGVHAVSWVTHQVPIRS